MIKEIRYGGYTTEPSDYECPDGDLAGAMNLVPEDEQLRPIMPPGELMTLPDGYRLWLLHEVRPHDNYIFSNGDTLYWLDENVVKNGQKPVTITASMLKEICDLNDDDSVLAIKDIKAIGNTLVVLTAEDIHYLLWKGADDDYVDLGTHLPDVDISFGLQGEAVRSDEFTLKLIKGQTFEAGSTELDEDNVETVTSQVLAKVNKLVAENSVQAGKFMFPFLVRYAFRLYDGSTLTMHSSPVLMNATMNAPLCFTTKSAGEPRMLIDNDHPAKFRVAAFAHKLDYQVVSPAQLDLLRNWSDIVTGVAIFVSAPFYTYDQAGKCEGISSGGWGYSVCKAEHSSTYSLQQLYQEYTTKFGGGSYPRVFSVELPEKSIGDIGESIASCSSFYLLKEYKLDELQTSRTKVDVSDDYLQSLLTRETMTDDWDSHDSLKADFASVYNARLNLAGVSKTLWGGSAASAMFQYTNDNQTSVRYRVGIIQEGKEIIVQGTTSLLGVGGYGVASPYYMPWFYWPNNNAYRMWLQVGTTWYSWALSKHPTLNGAYVNIGWNAASSGGMREQSFSSLTPSGAPPAVTSDNTISLTNKIYTSEVNNPFVFPVTHINTIGTSEIMGMAAATKALSQGQYGQFPLYLFTSDGVWALEVSKEGAWGSKTPVTRDVCINPGSITQIDQAVLFATDRGIMLLSGSNSVCISDDIFAPAEFDISTLGLGSVIDQNTMQTLTYAPFLEFLRGCRMIYDYVHQRIIVYSPGYKYAYVYSLKSKKWGMAASDIAYSVPSYPEALAVRTDEDSQTVVDYTLQDDTQYVNGTLITRPLKLEPANVLKTINTVIQRGYFRRWHKSVENGEVVKNPHVKSILLGSRDLFHWFVVASSRDLYLQGFRGTPYKYFRIVLLLDLAPEESVWGCTVQYEPRFMNRPR